MEEKESLRFDPKLFFALILGAILIYFSLTISRGALSALLLYIFVVLVMSAWYFGQQFLRILFMPMFAAFDLIEYVRTQHHLRKYALNVHRETVIVLAYPDWKTFKAWVKPNYTFAEIKTLIRYLESTGKTHSFFTHASIEDIEKIMRDQSVQEVGFYGHGDSHTFCLSNNLTVFYCDYNKPEYSKQYVHQIHCGTKEGKSLIDYIIRPENKSRCFFFRRSITGREIIKELKSRTNPNWTPT